MEFPRNEEELVAFVARCIRHRESFYREQWLEEQGWKVRQRKVFVDGYEDPESAEVLDAETAFTVAQTRQIIRMLKAQEEGEGMIDE